jgi:hypothetical protein
MSEHQKQAAFLKTLISYEDTTAHEVLKERLICATRNERCLWYSCRLVAVIALVGLSGLGYSALLMPEFFERGTHLLIQFFGALGLGSLMCLSVFLGLWFWYRSMVNRVHDACRRAITSMIQARLGGSSTTATLHPLPEADPFCRMTTLRDATSNKGAEQTILDKTG